MIVCPNSLGSIVLSFINRFKEVLIKLIIMYSAVIFFKCVHLVVAHPVRHISFLFDVLRIAAQAHYPRAWGHYCNVFLQAYHPLNDLFSERSTLAPGFEKSMLING